MWHTRISAFSYSSLRLHPSSLSIMFELIRPWTLLLLIPALLVLGWYLVRSLSDFPRPQRMVTIT